jgi:ppGpp synthetase/RelA/SpoT-type nucleotidyltranferase
MADTPLSKGAIDRAGKRLRDEAVPRPEDVAVYEQYRASLGDSLDEVVRQVGAWDPGQPHQPITTRLKRIESTIDKLRRGNFRLTGINDIAGCRLVVSGLARQDEAVSAIAAMFPGCRVTDYRRGQHVSGYVAVHLNVRSSRGHLVEVQVRTIVQNRWAVVSEHLSRLPQVGKEIKYGGGPANLRDLLGALSREGVLLDRLVLQQTGPDERLNHRLIEEIRNLQHEFEARIDAILRVAGVP